MIPGDPMPYPPTWRRTADPGSDEMPACVCGCPVIDHAASPDLPCLACSCETYREEDR